MIIGIPKEIKDNEYRVSITPAAAESLVFSGHTVLVQTGAGTSSGFLDNDYVMAGATICRSAEEVWNGAEMVMKVKEPQEAEYQYLREGLIYFAYLHLAPEYKLTRALIDNNVTAIAYETIQTDNGNLPCLTPMSEVAGRMSIQIGAKYLERENGGRGILLSGVPGVARAEIVILGAGTVGANAAKIALGMGAHVTIIDTNTEKMRYLDDISHGCLTTLGSNRRHIADSVQQADLVIGGVLIPGAKAPKVVTRDMVMSMKPGSVIVDVSIDQGGCIETSKPTTHSNPIYKVNDVIHYCVTNIPGAVPRTSTYALSNTTLPYALKIANLGFDDAIKSDAALAKGVNTHAGNVTYKAVADAHNLDYVPIET
ncbi:MAG TPA: alanine dehydrogenase [Candidatus Lokiarchaeia archaeon]|nr:alanine dehydrogenase [Candidatus Lokiarchaeia archaeon]